jgi:ABC-type lipoprotein export system ATPase subunit
MVTHDLRLVQYVDRVIQMMDGNLARIITDPDEICEMATLGKHEAPATMPVFQAKEQAVYSGEPALVPVA